MREGRGSCSLLQRALGIGYGRAARIIDFMAEDGIVGAYNGSQAREVIMSHSDWELMKAGPLTESTPKESKKKGTRRVDADDKKESSKGKNNTRKEVKGSKVVAASGKSPSKSSKPLGLKNLAPAGPLTLHYGTNADDADEEDEFDIEQSELDAEDTPWHHPHSDPDVEGDEEDSEEEGGLDEELESEEDAFEEDEEAYDEYDA